MEEWKYDSLAQAFGGCLEQVFNLDTLGDQDTRRGDRYSRNEISQVILRRPLAPGGHVFGQIGGP